MKNADKVTMTVSQLKRLIKESVSDDGDFEIRKSFISYLPKWKSEIW